MARQLSPLFFLLFFTVFLLCVLVFTAFALGLLVFLTLLGLSVFLTFAITFKKPFLYGESFCIRPFFFF